MKAFIFSAKALHKLAKNITSFFMEEEEAIRRLLGKLSHSNNLPIYIHVDP